MGTKQKSSEKSELFAVWTRLRILIKQILFMDFRLGQNQGTSNTSFLMKSIFKRCGVNPSLRDFSEYLGFY
jgi:hypothetical protein